MYGLTVAAASGVIAAAIHIMQFLVPNLIIFILAGLIKSEHNAVTWSVVGRALHGSFWPMMLRGDTAATKGVARSVTSLVRLKIVSYTLLTIAAVLTPLGLYEALEVSDTPVLVDFSYVPDGSPMGYGTLPLSDQWFTRKCLAGFLPLVCPDQDLYISYHVNGSDYTAEWNGTYDVRVPEKRIKIFQSGLYSQKPTVSSFFDVQSRQYAYRSAKYFGYDHDCPYVVSNFRQVTSVVLDDSVQLFEGVVLDAQNGAVGFRNHTVPQAEASAVEWTEELLFIEPETECVDMNITLDFKFSGFSSLSELYLVDHGGFYNLSKKPPKVNLTDLQYQPGLRDRAYRAAWQSNLLTMLYLNITNPDPHGFRYLDSEEGAKFPVNIWGVPLDTGPAKASQWASSSNWGELLDFANSSAPYYPNPYNISSEIFLEIDRQCGGETFENGVDFHEYANSSYIGVVCGQTYGIAKRNDGGDPRIMYPNASLSQPLYACASSSKALIKVVRFRYNVTSEQSLDNLKVVSISDKVYNSTDEMPIWGMENLHMNSWGTQQLWGLVDKSYQSHPNITLFQKDSLYLPRYVAGQGTEPGIEDQHIPAATVPTLALSAAYMVGTSFNSWRSTGAVVRDYSGISDVAMATRWESLSRDPASTAQIINLIFADLTANSLVGTRSWNTDDGVQSWPVNGTSQSGQRPKVPVTIIRQRLQYHWVYAIPALLFLLIAGGIFLAALVCGLFARSCPATVRKFLNVTSAGRLLVQCEDLNALSYDQSSTEDWIKYKGTKMVSVASGKQELMQLEAITKSNVALLSHEQRESE